VDVGTTALLAALVTVWLPEVAAAAAEWSGPGAGGSSRAMGGWWPGVWLWLASKTALTMVGMSAVVSGLGSSEVSVGDVLLVCLDAGCALAGSWHFLEPRVVGVFVLVILGILY